jgi:hypothetical protein
MMLMASYSLNLRKHKLDMYCVIAENLNELQFMQDLLDDPHNRNMVLTIFNLDGSIRNKINMQVDPLSIDLIMNSATTPAVWFIELRIINYSITTGNIPQYKPRENL